MAENPPSTTRLAPVMKLPARGEAKSRMAPSNSSGAPKRPAGVCVMMLATRSELLAIERDYPAFPGQALGVVAPWDASRDGGDAQFEVRAFVGTRAAEDPVTGSLNAGLAQWLIGAGLAPDAYIASQGTRLGRAGRVHVARVGDDIWIGGETITCIEGQLDE